MEKNPKPLTSESSSSAVRQHEDAVLKTAMHFFPWTSSLFRHWRKCGFFRPYGTGSSGTYAEKRKNHWGNLPRLGGKPGTNSWTFLKKYSPNSNKPSHFKFFKKRHSLNFNKLSLFISKLPLPPLLHFFPSQNAFSDFSA